MKLVKRICLLLLAAALVLFVGCGLLSPLLLQSIGSRVAGQYGIHWESSSANGFKSLRLEQVELEQDGLLVRIDTLQLPQPGPWLLSRAGLRRPPEVRAGTIEVHLRKSDVPTDSPPPGPEILETIRNAFLSAASWLPDLDIDELRIAPVENSRFPVANTIRLRGRSLSAETAAFNGIPALDLRVLLTGSGIRLAAAGGMDDGPLRLIMASESLPSGESIHGRLVSKDVPLTFRADFEAGQWRPKSVSAESQAWPVPLALLPDESQIHASPKLDLKARVTGDSFTGDLHLESPETGPRREAAAADIRLSGNSAFVEVSRLEIQSSWLTAELSQAIRYRFADTSFSSTARFHAQAELDNQSWVPAKGSVTAEILFEPDVANLPQLDFRITGTDLVVAGQSVPLLSLNGLLDYPKLSIGEFVAGLPANSQIRGDGDVFLDRREIEGKLSYQLSPDWLESLWPTSFIRSDLSGTLRFSGDPGNLQHSGQLEPVDLEVGGVHPLRLALEWAGQGTRSIDLLAAVESGPGGALHLVAEVEPVGGAAAYTIRIAEAEFSQAGAPVLTMQEPATLQLDPAAAIPVTSVSDLSLQGSMGAVSGWLEMDKQALSLEVSNLDSGFLRDWLIRPGPRIIVDSGTLMLGELDPFVEGSFAFQAHTASEQLELLSLSVKGTFTDSGIEVETLEGLVEDTPFVRGNLGVPVRIALPGSASGKRIVFSPEGNLNGSLSSEISRELADDFSEIPFLNQLAGTQINLEMGGSLDRPVGTVEATLAALPGAMFDPRLEGYQIEHLTVSARLEPETVTLEALRGQLREATIAATGTLETGPLVAFANGSEPDWRNALRNADLAVTLEGFRADSFTSLLPGYLRPTGSLAADLAVEPGPQLSGVIRLEGFSLRPTLYTQTIDDINVILDLEGSRLSLNTASASVGGSVVTASGFVDIGRFKEPLYRLEISGIRTPLVRTPDLLLHADVDLVLDRSDAGSAGTVDGTLLLRDSVLLMDIDPLAARTAGRGLPKPPFFRVPVEPFSEWELDIRVTGEDALRFRSQYAKALLSANMTLDGTLGAPVLIGDIFSTEGQIQFPGMRMRLSRSEIFVTREQQQTLQIDLNATGRTASTIISMRVGGSVDEPHVEFSSTPALSNAQIFHLLATGSLQGSGVSNIGLYLGKGLLGPGSSDNSLLDRLSVEVGRDVSETGESTIDLYLQLTERLRLHGEYDKYDDQNLNLEWEVFTK